MAENEAYLWSLLVLFYRGGRWGILSLLGLLRGILHRHGQIDIVTTYGLLYMNPVQARRQLVRGDVISFGVWRQCAIAAAKHLIKRDAPYREDSPYVPMHHAFLDYFEACRAVGEFMPQAFIAACEDRLMYHHFYPYGATDFEAWCERFRSLLRLVPDDVILNYPMAHEHALYWIAQKGKAHNLTLESVTCQWEKIYQTDDKVFLAGILYAPWYGMETPSLTVTDGDTETAVTLFECQECYYLSYEKTRTAYGFQVCLPWCGEKALTLCFRLTLGGKVLPITMTYAPYCAHTQVTDKESQICIARQLSWEQQRIWLYSDYKTVEGDNAYLQFMHDFDKDDGVLRYYVLHTPDVFALFEKKHYPYLLDFGSEEHRRLYLCAEKILASFVDATGSVNPYDGEDFSPYADKFHAQVIYLQHGVLHAYIPWRYSPVSSTFRVDRIVTSTHFERESFIRVYHFEATQLIECGMARYDMMPREGIEKKRRILYAPSWRAYVSDVVGSSYFQATKVLLNSPQLIAFLEEYDLELDVKMHPLYASYAATMGQGASRIHFVSGAVTLGEYCCTLTDFSSYVFDFVYYQIPVIYFFPDYVEFKAGRYQYRQLTYLLEEGFGPLCLTTEATIDALRKLATRGFVMEDIYAERMAGVFLELHDCREKLYRELMGQ